MQNNTKQSEETQLAVLADRMQAMLSEFTNMRKAMHDLANAQHNAVLDARLNQERLSSIDAALKKLNEEQETQDKTAAAIAQTVAIHAHIWKVIGTGAVMSAGVIGWLLSTINDMKEGGNRRDTRISVIEYALKQSEAGRYLPPQASISGPK